MSDLDDVRAVIEMHLRPDPHSGDYYRIYADAVPTLARQLARCTSAEATEPVEQELEAVCRIYADAFLNISWEDINADLQTHMALRDAVRRGVRKMMEQGVRHREAAGEATRREATR